MVSPIKSAYYKYRILLLIFSYNDKILENNDATDTHIPKPSEIMTNKGHESVLTKT